MVNFCLWLKFKFLFGKTRNVLFFVQKLDSLEHCFDEQVSYYHMLYKYGYMDIHAHQNRKVHDTYFCTGWGQLVVVTLQYQQLAAGEEEE